MAAGLDVPLGSGDDSWCRIERASLPHGNALRIESTDELSGTQRYGKLSPPSLAKHEAEREGAIRAYGKLVQSGIGHLAPGGILWRVRVLRM